MNNVPDMEMGRTFHSDAAPTNDYEGEILDKVRTSDYNGSRNMFRVRQVPLKRHNEQLWYPEQPVKKCPTIWQLKQAA